MRARAKRLPVIAPAEWRRLAKLAMLLSILTLPACGISSDYRNIKPKYEVRNAPIPVPKPRSKPASIINRASDAPVVKTPSAIAAEYRVRRGDTVYGVARRHGLDAQQIIRANGLRAPYVLRPGDRLQLPVPAYHMVRRGETSYGISRQYAVSLTSLVRLNGLKPPYRLEIGQRLKIPGHTSPPANNAGPSPRGQKKAALPSPPPRQGSAFMWPLKGRVLSSYGPKAGGLHNDGINIRAKAGSAVRAAEAGIVVYSADGLKGYGNLILIRHSDGWVTAYAHNEELLVKRGDTVGRGQLIARSGNTGGVKEPQLHFEVRKGTTAVNPLKYLAAF
ncbi:MAG: M23 family metallopeptidase [Proteobacteria bacterium]|nr:M23 family metallopeptidase [Pseudomonadota bacterium]